MPCQRHNFKKEKKINFSNFKENKILIFIFFSFLCRSCSFLTNKHSKIEKKKFYYLFPSHQNHTPKNSIKPNNAHSHMMIPLHSYTQIHKHIEHFLNFPPYIIFHLFIIIATHVLFGSFALPATKSNINKLKPSQRSLNYFLNTLSFS